MKLEEDVDVDVTVDDDEEPTWPSKRFQHLQPLKAKAPSKPTITEIKSRENKFLSWALLAAFVAFVVGFIAAQVL